MTQRLFLGVFVPEEARNAIAAAQEEVKKQFSNSKVTWVAPENFHATLHFLGDVEGVVRDRLISNLQTVEYPKPFETSVTAVDAFPGKKNPRTLFVGLSPHPSFLGLWKRLADKILEHGFCVDRKTWLPHVTIGRVNVRSEVLKPEVVVVEPAVFSVMRFGLYQSDLTRQGSVYTLVHEFFL